MVCGWAGGGAVVIHQCGEVTKKRVGSLLAWVETGCPEAARSAAGSPTPRSSVGTKKSMTPPGPLVGTDTTNCLQLNPARCALTSVPNAQLGTREVLEWKVMPWRCRRGCFDPNL
jgi:hypothetical protein